MYILVEISLMQIFCLSNCPSIISMWPILNNAVFFTTFSFHFCVTRLLLLKLPGRPVVLASLKKKSSTEKLCLMWTYMLIKACLALFRAGVWHIQCSPEWGKVRMQQLDGSWCKELQVSEPKVTPVQLLYRLSLQCYPTCHSWLKNLSSHLYWR